LRVSLLRAPTEPDPRADRGTHRFVYAVMPHAGGFREAGVVAEAHRLNASVLWTRGGATPRSFASVDDPNLVLDTIKKAEDSGALVVRLYEAHGARGTARITIGLPFREALFCNLLEDDGPAAKVSGDLVEVPYAPFQIVSLKLR